ncbi:hypothetical protein [Orenia marismortui]|uniref:DUF6079 domain-containing protein n=1 Tax=Orenia marismortui TaxID=46469 RepID=A0A4R8HBN2_9FIRM|nr:hypothetical protein [Orenia marismortui]TDX53239.1 hypothetical protein C7959_10391 [Orenia marismortui]
MSKIKDMIKTSQGFKYSINLKYDINDNQKIESYIPTDQSMEIMDKLINGFQDQESNRSHILLGSYGTGKSHLSMVLASLLSTNKTNSSYNSLFEKIKQYNNKLHNKMEEVINDKYLIVLPEEGLYDFERSIILGLRNSLKEHGLEDELPTTFYDNIVDKINYWKDKFSNTYQELKNILNNNYNIDIDSFIDEIKDYNRDYYQIFLDIYPKLTAGAEFTPYNRIRLVDLLQGMEDILKANKYKGILIVFDEFGKFLEENIAKFNIKDIQDLAEYCNREDNLIPSSLLLITHKNLSQYSTQQRLSTEEWRKVEGRFKRHNITQRSNQIYELISKVIIKEGDSWNKFKTTKDQEFKDLMFELKQSNLFSDLSTKALKDWILFGCYPLHPSTAFALFNLSKLIAQNQRTLFTFLSHKEEYSLNNFIENTEDEFPLLSLDYLYNYFLDLIQQEESNSRIYGIWKNAHRSLEKLSEEEIEERKFVKALAIINIISDFNRLAPNPDTIRSNLSLTKDQFDKVEANLINKKVIFYRKSIDQYKFFDGSDINLKKKIKEIGIERENYFQPINKLNKEYLLPPLLAHRYNFNNKILRFFTVEYLRIEEITNEIISNKISNNYLDGKIFVVLTSNKKEKIEAKRKIKDINNDQAIFILSKEAVEYKDILLEIDSIEYLLTQEDFLAQDPIIKLELETYLGDKKDELIKLLTQVYQPVYNKSSYYRLGQELKIDSKKELLKLISDICEDVFKNTMVVNHEMINKNKITGTMKRVRRDIIDRLINQDSLAPELDFDNFNAAHTVVRAVLVKNNILKYNKKTDMTEVQIPIGKPNLLEIIKEIKNFIERSQEEQVCFEDIYQKLQSPPFGLRKGYIPILLAAYFRRYRGRIVITHKDEDREYRSSIFDEIENNPKQFKLGIDLWDEQKETYIQSLEELFVEFIDTKLRTRNRLKALWEGMQSYYRSLPHYIRNTQNLNKEAMILKKILNRDFKNTHRLFFEFLPQAYGNDDFNEISLQIQKSVSNLNQGLSKLHATLIKKLLELKKLDYNQDLIVNDLFLDWYQDLPKEVQQHHFNWKVNTLFDLISEQEVTEKEFLNLMAERLTGFRLSNWNDQHLEDMISDIKDIFEEVDNYTSKNNKESEITLSYLDSGKHKAISFDSVEVSDLGKMLLSKIKGDLDNFGQAISEKEKASILIELLKEEL